MNRDGDGGEDDEDALDAEADDAWSLLAASRQSEAARARRRRRWRMHQRGLDRTIEDVMLGARGRHVTVHLEGGTTLSGTVEATGIDVARLRVAEHHCWVALGAIDAVEVTGVTPADPGDRDSTPIADVVEELAVTGAAVHVHLRSGARISGELSLAGAMIELRRTHPDAVVAIRTEAVAAVTLRSRLSR